MRDSFQAAKSLNGVEPETSLPSLAEVAQVIYGVASAPGEVATQSTSALDLPKARISSSEITERYPSNSAYLAAYELKEAQKQLDARIDDPSRNLSDQERLLLKAMEHAVLQGNVASLQTILYRFETSPKDFTHVASELFKDLNLYLIDGSFHIDTVPNTSEVGFLSILKKGSRSLIRIPTNPAYPMCLGVPPRKLPNGQYEYDLSVYSKDPTAVMKDIGTSMLKQIKSDIC